ncbi:MAG TPA: hypothetical protein VF311_12070 [Terriglobales bacterium]
MLKGPRATGNLRRHHSADTIALEISSRNARVAAPQKWRDRLRARLDLIIDLRGADMADLPGGASGVPMRG